jgi:hypothetical protein
LGKTVAEHHAYDGRDLRVINQAQKVADGIEVHAVDDKTVASLDAVFPLGDAAVE